MKFLQQLMLIVMCVIWVGNSSAATWVEITDSNENPPEIDLRDSSADSVVICITIPGFFKDDETEDQTTYQKIWFDEGELALADSGFPQLPVIRKLIAIPDCDSVIVDITPYGPNYLTNYLIYPAPNTSVCCEPSFCLNDSVYSTAAYYPDDIDVCSDIQFFREQQNVELDIRPISFSPDSSKIVVYDSIKVKLTFDNPSGSINNDVGIFCSAAQGMFLNYNLTYSPTQTDEGYSWETETSILSADCDYLIITAGFIEDGDECQEKIEELAQHRVDLNGFAVY